MTNASLSPRVLTFVSAGLLLVGLAEGFYSYRLTRAQRSMQAVVSSHGDMIQKLNRSVDEAKESYTDLQGEMAFTKDRLGTAQVELRRAQQSSARLVRQQNEATKQLGQLQQEQYATHGSVGMLSSDVAGVKDGLNSAKEQLASTRTDLQRVIGDLGIQSGLIATNRSELEELRLRGESDYYEFDLKKTKQPQRVGSLAITLKKTDQKRQRYTINVMSDDRTIEKKDKTLNEPVQFYQSGYRQPSEIVVNQIYKDRIVGYVSFPKKRAPRSTLSEFTPGGSQPGS